MKIAQQMNSSLTTNSYFLLALNLINQLEGERRGERKHTMGEGEYREQRFYTDLLYVIPNFSSSPITGFGCRREFCKRKMILGIKGDKSGG